ncbi:unnamed protein product [Schistosoma curassoni]|uniref:Uncharacterized protein n=1 Tax=Schistosoma curassoni TaxID=6186 RepID=A0A183JX01_9TREM|nr:unnamed protein product [Schistosoma curassoni]
MQRGIVSISGIQNTRFVLFETRQGHVPESQNSCSLLNSNPAPFTSNATACKNAVHALPTLAFTSASDPPCLSMMLHRYVKKVHIFQSD